VIGAFNFSESEVLAEVYRQALEAKGFDAELLGNVASREIMEPALEQAQIDMVVEYLGTALTFVDQDAASSVHSATEAKRALEEAFGSRGVEVLDPAPGQNRNEIVVTEDIADRYDLETISDLAPIADELTFGGPPECPGRPLCLVGLKKTYGLTFKAFQPLDSGGPVTVAALEGKEIDVALLFTTTPQITTDRLVVLEDDRHLQPAENIVPVIRRGVVDHNESIVDALDRVTSHLTDEALREINQAASIEHSPVATVAAQWLRKEGLI
jgi:osmoprotectant transport system substrate-binding protein